VTGAGPKAFSGKQCCEIQHRRDRRDLVPLSDLWHGPPLESIVDEKTAENRPSFEELAELGCDDYLLPVRKLILRHVVLTASELTHLLKSCERCTELVIDPLVLVCRRHRAVPLEPMQHYYMAQAPLMLWPSMKSLQTLHVSIPARELQGARSVDSCMGTHTLKHLFIDVVGTVQHGVLNERLNECAQELVNLQTLTVTVDDASLQEQEPGTPIRLSENFSGIRFSVKARSQSAS
jgi:hypothetical protein